MTLQDLKNQIRVWDDWKKRYKLYVPKFITEASTKSSIAEWDQDVFEEFFEKSFNQCVSSLQQGYFNGEEKERIKGNWHKLSPLLKTIADSQDEPLFDVYQEIKKVIRPYTDQNRMAATNRLVASLQPNLLCTIVNEGRLKHLMSLLNQKIENTKLSIGSDWFQNSFKILDYYKKNTDLKDSYELITYPWQTYELLQDNIDEIANNDMSEVIDDSITQQVDLLKYKKQIILQGPPGTGKTKLAKEIARNLLIANLKKQFTKQDLLSIVKERVVINTYTNYNTFEVVKIEVDGFKIYPKNAKLEYKVAFTDIVDCVRDFVTSDMVKKYDKKGVGTYIVGIAKYVIDNLEHQNNFLVQFHPSYTYEDFVRGIVAKPNPDGDGIIYEAENKIIGKFSKLALDNYRESQHIGSHGVDDRWLNEHFDKFILSVQDEIDEKGFYRLTDHVAIVGTVENAFQYKGHNWSNPIPQRMIFSDIKKLYLADVTTNQDILDHPEVSGSAKQHATYYLKVAVDLRAAISTPILLENNGANLKNYVLIIDEINRANLSSVLGELIYALEYRGEEVESIYEVDGNNTLTLPPNLFIIGTMNTADRSVGHIDYAIRRRFAFVDVMPKKLSSNDSIVFHSDLFDCVSKLFISNYDEYISDNTVPLKSAEFLSGEFEPKDVWLGHSYFIQKKINAEGGKELLEPEDFNVRVKYEIVPILREYIKDGILNPSVIVKVNEIEQNYLVN